MTRMTVDEQNSGDICLVIVEANLDEHSQKINEPDSNVVEADQQPTKQDYKVYASRWAVLFAYCILNILNAMIWTTFVSISDITQHYFGPPGSFYSSITGVNMLANIQLAVAVPGGFVAFWITKHQRPRRTMLFAAILTVLSSVIKLLAAIYFDSLSVSKVYAMMIIGQAIAGFIQPSITNFPASLSSIWFPVQERDVSTSIASMCSAIGSAIGSLVPPFLVTETAHSDGILVHSFFHSLLQFLVILFANVHLDTFTVHGMVNLMIFQVIANSIALLLVLIFFWDAPPTSPSHSEQLKSVDEKVAIDTVEDREVLEHEAEEPRTRGKDAVLLGRDLYALFTNVNYVILMSCFALGVGLFNALITVLNQFVEPLGYSNTAAGLFGAIFIGGGLLGAVVMGKKLIL